MIFLSRKKDLLFIHKQERIFKLTVSEWMPIIIPNFQKKKKKKNEIEIVTHIYISVIQMAKLIYFEMHINYKYCLL